MQLFSLGKNLRRLLRKSYAITFFLFTKYRFPKERYEELQFITASDSSHFHSSVQLLDSIFRYEDNPIVTYIDLGLLPSEILQIKAAHPNVDIQRFPFEDYPAWMNMNDNSGQYAWKAISIQLFRHDLEGIVVWLDAGCKITKNISLVRSIAEKNGIFILPANCSVGALTHSSSIKELRFEDCVDLPMFSAAFIAFNLRTKNCIDILDSWVRFSKTKEVIAPTGSSRLNHRFDQSLISILIHKSEKLKSPSYRKIPSRYFGFLIHQDIEMPSD